MGTILKHKGRSFVTGTPQMAEYNEITAKARENKPGARNVADMMNLDSNPVITTPDGKQITSVDEHTKAKVAQRKEIADAPNMSLPERIRRKFDKTHEPYAGRDPASDVEADRMIEILGRDKVERN